jgi:hypothetical protein
VPPAEVSVRVLYGDSKEVDMQALSLYEIQCIAEKAMAAFDAADNGKAQPSQCNWCELCANAATCPAYRAVAEAVASRQDLATVTEHWDSLTPAEMAQSLALAETVSKWADAVKGKAKETLQAGRTIADADHGISYTLRTSKGRTVPYTANACKMLIGHGVSPDAIREKLTIGAQACKELLRSVGVKGKAATELVESVSEIGPGTVSMVRG